MNNFISVTNKIAMLPSDLKNLILSFHDEFGICQKLRHVNLIIKSSFAEWRGRAEIESDMLQIFSDELHPREIRWAILTTCLKLFDKRLINIRDNNECFSKLWTGRVPWD